MIFGIQISILRSIAVQKLTLAVKKGKNKDQNSEFESLEDKESMSPNPPANMKQIKRKEVN